MPVVNWVRGLLSGAEQGITAAVRSLIAAAVGGLAAVIDTLTGNVSGAWSDLHDALHGAWTAQDAFETATARHLARIITHDIPVYAYRSWWLLTHPQVLAKWLGWHLVRWLEDNAWSVAGHLGGFLVSLVLRNPRRLALAAEHIITAIL